MHKMVLLGYGLLLTVVCGCILSTTPDEKTISIKAGDTLTFAVQVLPASAELQWYLDGNPLSGETGVQYTYAPIRTDFGNHEIRIVENSLLGEYSETWLIAVSYLGWGTAQCIEGSGFSDYPRVAFDAEGNAIAVWRQYDATGSYSIHASRYVPETGWSAVHPIEFGSGNTGSPKIVSAASGTAVAAWAQYDGEYSSIYANHFIPGSGWGLECLVETTPWTARDLAIAGDSAGNVIAVWSQAGRIFSNRYTYGVGWGIEEVISSGPGDEAWFPQVACDAEGNAIAVWQYHDSTMWWSIFANRFISGIGWGEQELIESQAGNAYYPQIAFDPSGSAMAVWYEFDAITSITSIWANRFKTADGWGEEELIESGVGDSRDPQIACDKDGNAIAVWEQDDGTSCSIYANIYEAGVGWGIEEPIESGTGDAYDPQIVCDSQNRVFVVWHQSDGIYNSVFANSYVQETGWGIEEPIESIAGDNVRAQIACDPEDNIIAIWDNYNLYIEDDIWVNWYKLHQPDIQ